MTAAIALVTLLAFSGYELGYCEGWPLRCTTITDDTGVCPSTSIQVGRRCVFPSQEPAMTEQPPPLHTDWQRLSRIRQIVEAVDQRCMAADGPVLSTLQEMTQSEISAIYALACGQPENWRPT